MTEFKLRFYGSVLGYAWTLVRPFALFGVLYIVFAEIAQLGEGVKGFPAYILISMVLFQFFRAIVDGGLLSLVDRENLLRKMRFPRLVIPTAVVLSSLFELGLTLCAVLVFLLISGICPTWGWLELIPLAALLTVFATRPRAAALRPLRALPRHVADLGRASGRCSSTPRRSCTSRASCRTSWRELYMLNPIAVHPHADAPRADRLRRADRDRRDRRLGDAC